MYFLLTVTRLASFHDQRTRFTETANQLEVDLTPSGNGLPINRDNFIVCLQACLCSKTTFIDFSDDRLHLLSSKHG